MEYRGAFYLFKNSSIARTIVPIATNGVKNLTKNIGANSKDCITKHGACSLAHTCMGACVNVSAHLYMCVHAVPTKRHVQSERKFALVVGQARQSLENSVRGARGVPILDMQACCLPQAFDKLCVLVQ